jgi:hypothetical protein
MSPWIPGFTGRDQLSFPKGHKSLPLLPWQSFPATGLYFLFATVVTATAAAVHSTLSCCYTVENQPWNHPWYSSSLFCLAGTAAITSVLSPVPCLALFVLFVYLHALDCSPPKDSGDCTHFVKFRDPGMQVMRHLRYALLFWKSVKSSL